MYSSTKWTKYESLKCWCGNNKKLICKYCSSCSNKLNLLRAKVRIPKDLTLKEHNRKELIDFIKINNL